MKDRAIRLASSAKRELADMLTTKKIRELSDPRLDGLISITEVIVERGNQHIRFYLSAYKSTNPQAVLAVLQEASSAIRGELCRRLKLRVAPTVAFYLDDSLERSFRIGQLLDEI